VDQNIKNPLSTCCVCRRCRLHSRSLLAEGRSQAARIRRTSRAMVASVFAKSITMHHSTRPRAMSIARVRCRAVVSGLVFRSAG